MTGSKLDLTNIKMRFTIQREREYTFPQFLKQLRKVLGKTRSAVSQDLGISYDQMFRLESGRFLNYQPERVEVLAVYFGVKPEVMHRKFHDFLTSKKVKV